MRYDNGAAPAGPTRECIYSGGSLLAKVEAGATKYYHQDHLSNRVITDSSGTVVAQSGHFPFGENWYESGGINKLKFTSYERDPESGNDYAMARYHINRLGRFNLPDPVAGSIANPQSLNRYAYALNGPTNLTDPLGKDAASPESIAMWWLWNRFNGTGTTWDGDMISGGGFGPAFFEEVAQGMARYLAQVNAAFLKANLLDLLKKKPKCAELLGGYENAVSLVNNMRLSDVRDPNWSSGLELSPEARAKYKAAAEDINSGSTVAQVFYPTQPRKGSKNPKFASIFAPYVSGPIDVLYGGAFANYSHSEQLSVLIHELMHPAWAGTPRQSMVDMRFQGGMPESMKWINQECGTAIPGGGGN